MCMNKVLIMGGNGFLGKNIASYFQTKEIPVAVYDVTAAENSSLKSYQGDVFHDEKLPEILSNYDTLIYLISTVSPKKSMDEPESAYTNDIPMLLRTLEAAREAGVKRVIFASSGGTIYGEGEGRELKEDSDTHPINHYAIAKLAAEKILLMYNERYGMENIILRIGNPYGMGQNPKSGVGALTIFTNKILNGEEILLYADPESRRDYLSAEKVAEAFCLAYGYRFDREVTPVFNIGSGKGYTLLELIALIEDTLNTKAKVRIIEARGYDVKCNVLNVEKAKKYLNYQPEEDEKEKMKEYILQLKEKK